MISHKLIASALVLGVGLLTGCSDQSAKKVSFQTEVFPIVEAKCLECHMAPDGEGYTTSGLSMASYDDLMKGTKHGPIIKPGNSVSSTLNILIEGRADPSIRMPHGDVQLFEDEIAVLKDWVDQGAENN